MLPKREGVVYKNKPGRKPGSKNAKSYKAKNGKAKEPETAAEAMALIRASKQEALKGPAHSEMEAAMKRIALRYGTQHIRAFLDRLEPNRETRSPRSTPPPRASLPGVFYCLHVLSVVRLITIRSLAY